MTTWLDAFNARDLDGMLDCADAEIELHPLRVAGLAPVYRGHGGLRAWLRELEAKGHLHRIGISSVRGVTDARVLVSGAVTLEELGGVTPFAGLYTVDVARIVEIHHYFTHPEILESLGMLDLAPPPPGSRVAAVNHGFAAERSAIDVSMGRAHL